jgi:hypothetical protein
MKHCKSFLKLLLCEVVSLPRSIVLVYNTVIIRLGELHIWFAYYLVVLLEHIKNIGTDFFLRKDFSSRGS